MISVVIPTLDAVATLPATLESVQPGRDEGFVQEIIVSDGGSHDGTVAVARERGCTVVEGRAGRGTQLSQGAGRASGRWLLFLHADTRLAPGWPDAARAFVERHDAFGKAAVFAFALDDMSRQARILERIVAARTRMLGLPYGDQGLLISRELYAAVGGFRPLPLMEDVDLVRRIGRGRLELLKVSAVTSAIRYRREGYARRMLRNAACLGLYWAGIPPRIIARLYG